MTGNKQGYINLGGVDLEDFLPGIQATFPEAHQSWISLESTLPTHVSDLLLWVYIINGFRMKLLTMIFQTPTNKICWNRHLLL